MDILTLKAKFYILETRFTFFKPILQKAYLQNALDNILRGTTIQKLEGRQKMVFVLFAPIIWFFGWALIWLDNKIQNARNTREINNKL